MRSARSPATRSGAISGRSPGRRPDHRRRGARSGPAAVPTRAVLLGPAPAGAARGGGANRDAGHRHRRSLGACRRTRRARGDHPDSHGLWPRASWPLARKVAIATGAETDRNRRVIVGPDLTIPGHPEIFVVGDAAVQPWKQDRPTPGSHKGPSGRPLRGEGHPSPRPGPAVRSVALQQPRRCRRDRPAVGRDRYPVDGSVRAAGRVHCVAAMARDPHHLPDRVLEPARGPHPLGGQLLQPRPSDPADHRHAAPATDRGTRAAGHRRARLRARFRADARGVPRDQEDAAMAG